MSTSQAVMARNKANAGVDHWNELDIRVPFIEIGSNPGATCAAANCVAIGGIGPFSRNTEKEWHSGKTKADIDAETKSAVVSYTDIMDKLVRQNKGVAAEAIVRSVLNYYRKFRLETMPRIEAGEYKDDVCFNIAESLNVLGIGHTGNKPMRAYYAGYDGQGYTLSQFEHVVRQWGDLDIGYSIRRVRAGDGEPVVDSAEVVAAKEELARLDKERCNKIADNITELEEKDFGELIKSTFGEFCGDVGEEKAAAMTIKEFMADHLEEFMRVLGSSITDEKNKIAEKVRMSRCANMSKYAEESKKHLDECAKLQKIIDSAPKPVPVYRYVMQLQFIAKESSISIMAYKPIMDAIKDDLVGRGFVVGDKAPAGCNRSSCLFNHDHKNEEYWGISIGITSSTKPADSTYMYIDL